MRYLNGSETIPDFLGWLEYLIRLENEIEGRGANITSLEIVIVDGR